MPQRFAKGFDAEAVKAMMAAFDQACDALGLARIHDRSTEHLAKTIVKRARAGERDPAELCAKTIETLRRQTETPKPRWRSAGRPLRAKRELGRGRWQSHD